MQKDNAFLTLTYSDENLPLTSTGLGTLKFKHLQDWLKRLRKEIEPLRIRYYAVGEYGEQTERPHYHVALFGYPSCRFGVSQYSKTKKSCCAACDVILRTWGHGQILSGTLELSSASYVAGYVTKKMTRKDDPRLLGRDPEFGRMSLKPGIGGDFMHEVASTLMSLDLEKSQGDVPSHLRHGGREMPLGRYLQRRLRKLVGKDERAPQETFDQVQAELRPLLLDSIKNSRSLKQEVVQANNQKRLNQSSKQKLKRGKKTL